MLLVRTTRSVVQTETGRGWVVFVSERPRVQTDQQEQLAPSAGAEKGRAPVRDARLGGIGLQAAWPATGGTHSMLEALLGATGAALPDWVES